MKKRDYLKQFKIGKATYSESLIYEAYGGLQNDGIMLAVYYDVDAAKNYSSTRFMGEN